MGLVECERGRGRRGRGGGLGGGAGEGILGVGDEMVDFGGGATFWGGLLGRKSCGGDGMGDGEQVLIGETGTAVSFGLRGNGGLL